MDTCILAKADAQVEPAFKLIKESDRKLYIRQDATRAHNKLATVETFFKKYGVTVPDLLTQLSTFIDTIEADLITK